MSEGTLREHFYQPGPSWMQAGTEQTIILICPTSIHQAGLEMLFKIKTCNCNELINRKEMHCHIILGQTNRPERILFCMVLPLAVLHSLPWLLSQNNGVRSAFHLDEIAENIGTIASRSCHMLFVMEKGSASLHFWLSTLNCHYTLVCFYATFGDIPARVFFWCVFGLFCVLCCIQQ